MFLTGEPSERQLLILIFVPSGLSYSAHPFADKPHGQVLITRQSRGKRARCG